MWRYKYLCNTITNDLTNLFSISPLLIDCGWGKEEEKEREERLRLTFLRWPWLARTFYFLDSLSTKGNHIPYSWLGEEGGSLIAGASRNIIVLLIKGTCSVDTHFALHPFLFLLTKEHEWWLGGTAAILQLRKKKIKC